MKAGEIRLGFVEHYKSLGCVPLPRAPLLHPAVPMSFVMSAGLPQVETSLAKAKDRSGNQFVLVQDCFRHFDITKVGTNRVHLSFFEMPGAFFFKPENKPDIVYKMWEMATSILGINKNNLWATYFKGGKVLETYMPSDEQTHDSWIDVGLPENRVIGLGIDDNFWIQGNGIIGADISRNAGPNTELFYEHGSVSSCSISCRPGCRCGRFIEFSNTLFIEYEQNLENGTLQSLEETYAETVIGTERVATILQGVNSVFDIDIMRPITNTIHDFVPRSAGSEQSIKKHENVIADFTRGLYALVKDGAPKPGKNGRQRIVKLLIRGILTHQIILGIDSKQFMPDLIKCLSDIDRRPSKDPRADERRMLSYYSYEAKRYSKTIQRGYSRLSRLLANNVGQTLTGSQIVNLEKQYGLPHLLTESALVDLGYSFSKCEYDEALAEWRQQRCQSQ